ncbi:uncharacterized protein BO80DRAFT_437902 [Aspergillus ibericus CBS 121593]|uniref:Uncharacterized protein n=1 Tax=Aspergillus ibericus CBS 121593 TaxID=1448316 RepID=A0A395GPB0_9EURO|nr:hypothetical protein BO80DRAFT_437902 [Aspergillus ibericus CBS 121593]RAK97335.1 hypothetical protein BO80DRAFT_437902 [Aspergillus ibericus CBS 121593]
MSQVQKGQLIRLLEAYPAQVVIVPMGEVAAVSFHDTVAIGTMGLGSCSVIIIASADGAILAHIPPRPPTALLSDVNAGDNNVRRMTQRVPELYRRHRNEYFSRPTDTVIVYYAYGAGVIGSGCDDL